MHSTRLSTGLTLLLIVGLAGGCSKGDEQAPTAPSPAAALGTPLGAAPSPADDLPDELYVDLEGEPDEGPPPLTVKFMSEVDDGTPPYSYHWDFGDGSPAGTDSGPTHVYEKEGEFVVTLTVTDSKGLKGAEEYDILVEAEE